MLKENEVNIAAISKLLNCLIAICVIISIIAIISIPLYRITANKPETITPATNVESQCYRLLDYVLDQHTAKACTGSDKIKKSNTANTFNVKKLKRLEQK
jgi:Tfp pilus assembly major pilin PilA